MKNILLTTCAIALSGFFVLMADVKIDYNHHADFATYKTFSWLKVDAGNSLWTDRIKRDVDRQLTAKGWTEQPSGGQVALTAMGRTKEEQTYNTFYDGLGGGWLWGGFGGESTTNVENTPVGTLTVDMFDGQTKKLIWRGVATKSLSDNPEKNSKTLENAVKDMFKKFPPKAEG